MSEPFPWAPAPFVGLSVGHIVINSTRGLIGRSLEDHEEFFVKSRMILSTIVLVVALALAPAAFADNSSVGTYAGQGGEVAGSVAGGEGADPGETANSSALPFTGLDLGVLAGGGLVLLLGGFGMARMAARREDTV